MRWHSDRVHIRWLAIVLLGACLLLSWRESQMAWGDAWPAPISPYPESAVIDKPLHATIDITDDMWRSKGRFTRSNIQNLMKYLASIKVSQVYWMRTPDRAWSDWLVKEEGDADDAERMVVQAAHAAGLKCVAVYKPFDTGALTAIFPADYPYPRDRPAYKTLSGTLYIASPVIVQHPQWLIERRPLAVNPQQTVTAIKIVKSDDAPATLSAEEIEIWTSHINGDYTRRETAFSLSDGIEQRGKSQVRVLTLSDLNIPADQQYIMIRAHSSEETDFANLPSQLIELYGQGNVQIPSTPDDGVIPADSIKNFITRLSIDRYGHEEVKPEDELPDAYGKMPETSSFYFGMSPTYFYGASPIPPRQLGGPDGCIVVAKGKEMRIPAMHPIYPEVRAYWLAEIQSMINNGFDGFDFRVDNHSTWMADPYEYGFNDAIVQEYLKRYGVNILTQDFDVGKWKALQGEYYTEFLRSARALTRKHGRTMQVHVNGMMGNVAPDFALNNIPVSIEWQWQRWISEDLCDSVLLKLLPWPWGAHRGQGAEFAAEIARFAHEHGKQVVADGRIQNWKLITKAKGEAELTNEEVLAIVNALSWGWHSSAVDVLNLYEVFDFVYMDPQSGNAYGSPIFERILTSIKQNEEEMLFDAPVRNWLDAAAPGIQAAR